MKWTGTAWALKGWKSLAYEKNTNFYTFSFQLNFCSLVSDKHADPSIPSPLPRLLLSGVTVACCFSISRLVSGSTCLSRQQNRTSSCCKPRIEGECTWMLKIILYRKVKVCEVKGRPGSRSATDWELTVLFTLSLVPNTSEQLDPIRSEPLITWLPTADILAFITVITNTCVYLDLLFQSSLLLPGLFFLFCWVLCYITVGNVLN